MKRVLLILALSLALAAPALSDCGNEPPTGTTAPDLITPVAGWLHKAIWEGTIVLPGGWLIQFGNGVTLEREVVL